MSSISVNTITDASGGATTSINGFTPSVSNMAGRNRIINGDMRIDQRNAGASSNFGTGGEFSTVDRWQTFENTGGSATNQQVVDAPAGFYNSLKVTVTSSATPASSELTQLQQMIEGFNTADLAWGTASAKTVTLSFWVKSSITGQFGGSVANNGTPSYSSYPFSYTISSANTWEYKTITIAGSTSGTWGATNGTGIRLYFNLGSGSNHLTTPNTWYGALYRGSTGDTSLISTNGATWQVTGVQLEEGSVATPFEHRQYGQELALCQRYYYVLSAASNQNTFFSSTSGYTSTQALCVIPFSNTMRTNPSLVTSGTASDYRLIMGGSFLTCSSVPTMDQPNPNSANLIFTVSSGIVVGYGGQALANNTTSAFLGFSAEL